MAIRKKTTAKSETVSAEETVKSGQNSSRVRTTSAADATGAPDNKAAKAQSPAAATHKSPARKSVNAAPAAELLVESSSVEKTTFDVALHQEEIRKEAYCNWLHNGCPQGSEHQDWLAAIEIVRARHEK
jgi:hypothetical protein